MTIATGGLLKLHVLRIYSYLTQNGRPDEIDLIPSVKHLEVPNDLKILKIFHQLIQQIFWGGFSR
jgi:hypothetical protein